MKLSLSKPLIPISKKQAALFACFLVLYEFLTYIANDMIMPGMIHVVHSFNASDSVIPTSLTLYILGGASLQVLLGPMSDAYGRRPMMILGASLFFLFTLLIACSQSMSQFLVARFFQGMGLCFIGVIGYATIQEIFEEMDAVRLIAIMANAAILAPLIGPLLGGVIIVYTSWRTIFIIIACSALIALWGLWRFMPESVQKSDRAEERRFSLRIIVANYIHLLQNPTFILTSLAIGVVGIPCVAWIGLAPIILISNAKLTVIQYGLWQLPIFGATILGNWVLHRLTYSFSLKNLIYFGGGIMSLGVGLMSLLPYLFGTNYIFLIPGVIIYFFSLSIISAPLNRYCLYVTSVTKGTASALLSLFSMTIGALGIEGAQLFYNHNSNFSFGFYCTNLGLVFILIVIMGFTLERKELNHDK